MPRCAAATCVFVPAAVSHVARLEPAPQVNQRVLIFSLTGAIATPAGPGCVTHPCLRCSQAVLSPTAACWGHCMQGCCLARAASLRDKQEPLPSHLSFAGSIFNLLTVLWGLYNAWQNSGDTLFEYLDALIHLQVGEAECYDSEHHVPDSFVPGISCCFLLMGPHAPCG